MTSRARGLFKKIINGTKAKTIIPESVALLRVFCEAENQHFLATSHLKKYGAVITINTKVGNVPRRNPWFDIQKESAAIMNSISTKIWKLGLKPEAGEKSNRSDLMF